MKKIIFIITLLLVSGASFSITDEQLRNCFISGEYRVLTDNYGVAYQRIDTVLNKDNNLLTTINEKVRADLLSAYSCDHASVILKNKIDKLNLIVTTIDDLL